MRQAITKATRARLIQQLQEAPEGYYVSIQPPTRSLQQNAYFHDLCGEIAKAGVHWMGKPRTAAQWKVLLISGHGIATGHGAEVVAGLEGEIVNIRESSASMGIGRLNSLIDYTLALCAEHDVKLPYKEAA